MNKKGKFKSNHLEISGVRYCFKGRGKINKRHPESKDKNFGLEDLSKVLEK